MAENVSFVLLARGVVSRASHCAVQLGRNGHRKRVAAKARPLEVACVEMCPSSPFGYDGHSMAQDEFEIWECAATRRRP